MRRNEGSSKVENTAIKDITSIGIDGKVSTKGGFLNYVLAQQLYAIATDDLQAGAFHSN